MSKQQQFLNNPQQQHPQKQVPKDLRRFSSQQGFVPHFKGGQQKSSQIDIMKNIGVIQQAVQLIKVSGKASNQQKIETKLKTQDNQQFDFQDMTKDQAIKHIKQQAQSIPTNQFKKKQEQNQPKNQQQQPPLTQEPKKEEKKLSKVQQLAARFQGAQVIQAAPLKPSGPTTKPQPQQKQQQQLPEPKKVDLPEPKKVELPKPQVDTQKSNQTTPQQLPNPSSLKSETIPKPTMTLKERMAALQQANKKPELVKGDSDVHEKKPNALEQKMKNLQDAQNKLAQNQQQKQPIQIPNRQSMPEQVSEKHQPNLDESKPKPNVFQQNFNNFVDNGVELKRKYFYLQQQQRTRVGTVSTDFMNQLNRQLSQGLGNRMGSNSINPVGVQKVNREEINVESTAQHVDKEEIGQKMGQMFAQGGKQPVKNVDVNQQVETQQEEKKELLARPVMQVNKPRTRTQQFDF